MIIAVLILSFTFVTLSIAHYTYKTCFYSEKNRIENPYDGFIGPQYEPYAKFMGQCICVMENAKFEWITIQAQDHTFLRGRYYHFRDNAPLIIAFHGYRSVSLRDCVGSFALAQHLGWNILAVDQRAHGRSDGNVITFGIYERLDCLCWCKYAAEHLVQNLPIVLYGISMGAATVLMATQLELPEEVSCVIADCPYSSPPDIIKKVCTDRGFSPKLVYPFIKLGAKLFGRFDLSGSSPVNAVKYAKIPILLIHGDDDRFVPYEMSRKIYYSAAPRCELQIFPTAGHGLCCMVDPDRYAEAILLFMRSLPDMEKHLPRLP